MSPGIQSRGTRRRCRQEIKPSRASTISNKHGSSLSKPSPAVSLTGKKSAPALTFLLGRIKKAQWTTAAAAAARKSLTNGDGVGGGEWIIVFGCQPAFDECIIMMLEMRGVRWGGKKKQNQKLGFICGCLGKTEHARGLSLLFFARRGGTVQSERF